MRRTASGVRPENPFYINDLACTPGWPEGPEPVPRAFRESFEGARPGLPVPRALRRNALQCDRYRTAIRGHGPESALTDGSTSVGRADSDAARGPRGAVVATDGGRSGVRKSADGCVGENGHWHRHCWRRQCAAFSRKLPEVTGAVVPSPASSMPTADARQRDAGGMHVIAIRSPSLSTVAASVSERDDQRSRRGRAPRGPSAARSASDADVDGAPRPA